MYYSNCFSFLKNEMNKLNKLSEKKSSKFLI